VSIERDYPNPGFQRWHQEQARSPTRGKIDESSFVLFVRYTGMIQGIQDGIGSLRRVKRLKYTELQLSIHEW